MSPQLLDLVSDFSFASKLVFMTLELSSRS